MNIIQQFDLPFEGILELHTGFYNSHLCTFPITIPDTVQTSIHSEKVVGFSVYPNPVEDILNINFTNSNNKYKLLISDLNGRIIKEMSVYDNYSVDISDLKAGIYIVSLGSDKGMIDRIKIAKK